MTASDSTLLPGLPGDNPLGFLAALGVQVALTEQGNDYRLHWTDDPIPYPVLTPARSLDAIADAVIDAATARLHDPVLDESFDPTLKLKPNALRECLLRGRTSNAPGGLSACLLAENSLDRNGKAKPSDLYFTAGQQKFVAIARTLLGEVNHDEIVADLTTPWRYRSNRESLMWDAVDDRSHALSHSDPTGSLNPKRTNPGAEALAVLGLIRYPCFASPQRTLTQGCSGTWKRGRFVWPLWSNPATPYAVRSLLAQVEAPTPTEGTARRVQWYQSWGVSRVMQSQIRRSDQGGYGTFGPSRVVWQRD
ncbi:MAG: hypothetical protein F4046_02085 [Acidimicrobiaceae bacterium]|nr:hypothetical protein [Acidimicrobiaceae bacterium]